MVSRLVRRTDMPFHRPVSHTTGTWLKLTFISVWTNYTGPTGPNFGQNFRNILSLAKS
jgi:hypothetical protein